MRIDQTTQAGPTLAFGPSVSLSKLAHELLLTQLTKHGNEVSPQHALALEQLLDGFTKQGLGINTGRRAYALPCGSGKTLSVVAWIAAQYQLGLGLSVAVAAQQIESLCQIKSSLIDAGVPEHLIGIRHAKGAAATYPDTGEADLPIMLGSHSRIQGSLEMPSFCRHRGMPRDLLIWDESLVSSETTTLDVHDAASALNHFCAAGDKPLLTSVLQRLQTKVYEERALQHAGGEASIFTLLSREESDAAIDELGFSYCSGFGWAALDTAKHALRQLCCPMSVLDVGKGATGLVLMRCRVVVDPALENIAVLDASYVVSELCKADPTIRDATTSAMLGYKRYTDVLVKQTTAPSGRWQFKRGAEAAIALNAAVNSIRDIPIDQSILIVTYMAKNGLDLVADLKRALLDRGIKPDHLLVGGKHRIRFTTWGKHTTDNSFADSQHVVALGVLRQSSATVAASMAGQKDNACYRMTREHLEQVELSLLACNIMQAMNRGNCRRVDANGLALPMTLHLITKELGLAPLLQSAMPGLNWETLSLKQPTRTEEATALIVEHVRSLPATADKISKRAIFQALAIELGKDAKATAMSDALIRLSMNWLPGSKSDFKWRVEGQSIVRFRVE